MANEIDGTKYPDDPKGWKEGMIGTMDDAIAFLTWCVFCVRCLLDPYEGFVDDVGEGNFRTEEGDATFTDEVSLHLHGILARVMMVMRGEGYDPADVTHQLIMAAMEGRTGERVPIRLAKHDEIIENRDTPEHSERRDAQRWVMSFIEKLKNMGAPIGEVDGGFAIPEGLLPPAQEAFFADMVRKAGGGTGEAEWHEGEDLTDALERGLASTLADMAIADDADIDPDSDDNDDDPFADMDEGTDGGA